MDINRIIITGTITRPPQMRTTNNGKSVASFSMSVEKIGGHTFYIDVDAWGKNAESVAQNITVTGFKVLVEGRLEQQSWTDKTTGEKKVKAVVVADSVAPISALTQTQAQQQRPQYPQQPQYGQAPQQSFYPPQQPPAYQAPQGWNTANPYAQQAQSTQPPQGQDTASGATTPDQEGLPY